VTTSITLLAHNAIIQPARAQVWLPNQVHWDTWLEAVQLRRNAIHAYKHRELGTHDEFLAAIVGYAALAHALDEQVPYF